MIRFALITSMILFTSTVMGAKKCKTALGSSSKIESLLAELKGSENRQKWSEYEWTDPLDHHSNYRYQVHALRIVRKADLVIKFLKNPLKYLQAERLMSFSIINSKKNYMLQDIGLIIDVPAERIVSTAPRDFSSNLEGPPEKRIPSLNDNYPIKSPSSIFRSTYENFVEASHNEITMVGGKNVSIRGGIVRVEKGQTVEDVFDSLHKGQKEGIEAVELFLSYLKDNDLPLIVIEKTFEGETF